MKRSRLFPFIAHRPEIGIALNLILYFVLLWGLFFRWPLLPFVLKGGSGIILTVIFFWNGVRPFTRMTTGKRWQRVQYLRMNQQEAPLSEFQPEADLARFSLPIVLTVRLSFLAYFCFALFWLAGFGVTILLWNTLGETGNPASGFLLWFVMGGIIIGLTGIFMYQRIEITEAALIVQKGLRRRKLSWEEATLFASVRLLDGQDTPVHYELSNDHVLLRWSASAPGFGLVSSPKEQDTYVQILTDLLAYIRAKTDLPLLKLN